MNERHLEQPDVKADIAELTDAVHDLAWQLELRDTALRLAIEAYVAPRSEMTWQDILPMAQGFYLFLSNEDDDDKPEDRGYD